LGFGEGVLVALPDGLGSGVAPSACGVAGALAAVVALAPVVGEAAESDGEGVAVGVGVDVEDDGDGDGDGDTGGLPVAVWLGLGFGLQLGDPCEDGVGEPDGAAVVPPLDEGEGTVVEGLPPDVSPPPLCPPSLFWVCCAEPMLPVELAGAMVWVRCCVRASALDPTTSTNAAAAASGRSQPYGAGAPPAVTGRSQRSAAAGKERRRSMTGPGPDGSASVISHAAGAGRGA
jgi:hypothetical protein